MRFVFRMNTQEKPGWIARILLTLTTISLVIVGFFFFTIALVAGALIAMVIGLRLWWMLRKLRKAQPVSGAPHAEQSQGALDGEYQVIERESGGERLPPKRQ